MPEGRGIVRLEAFEEFGNEPEFIIDSISAYEMLEGNLVRVFATRCTRGHRELAYTTVMALACFEKIAPRCDAIISEAKLPEWASPELLLVS